MSEIYYRREVEYGSFTGLGYTPYQGSEYRNLPMYGLSTYVRIAIELYLE